MSNVVRLRRPLPIAQTSPAFEEAWIALPDTARKRSSRKLAYPEWLKVAAEIGEADLVSRVKRYAAEDKDHKRECGAPGFDRWLRWGRWEHWEVGPPVVISTKFFPDPELRAAFHFKFQDGRARRWFDRCEWNPSTREVSNAGPCRKEWLEGPFNAWMKANGVKSLVFSA